ncbi:hypothetical protein [Mycolicibacterium fortuitum]|uniref:hypothetical protein n=1 Tax=Mycolicibacterium fortuitum TaxID=1766 RepID=UPI001F20846D|nr:hypothetical protein [Mycolicibacterium fortuitum]
MPGADTNDTFLYDDSFLHSNVSPPDAARSRGRDRVDAWCGARPGRFAGLLKPALEIMWVDDARRMNKFLTAEVPDNQVVAAAQGHTPASRQGLRRGRDTSRVRGWISRSLPSWFRGL